MAAALHPQSTAKWLSLMKNNEKRRKKIEKLKNTEDHARMGPG